MSEHLSALQLDEVVAGLTIAPEHLTACPACSGKLESLQAESAAFLQRPQAKRQLEALAPAPQRHSFLRVLAFAVPLAAGLALYFTLPDEPPSDRIKGAPTVILLDEAGNSVTQAGAGSRLTLAVGAAGFDRVEIFAVDAAGKKEPLYSGPVAAGARVPLTQLEVTPGDVTITAIFARETQTQSVSVRLSVP